MYVGRAAVSSKMGNYTISKRAMEYGQKSLKEKQYRDLFASEVALLNLCFEQYDIWCGKLEMEKSEDRKVY